MRETVIISVVCACCFSAALNGSFVFDDTEAIINNPDVNPNVPLSRLFLNDFWGTRLTKNSSHKSYRPLAVVAFRILRAVGGNQLNAPLFRATNLLIHAAVSCLIFQTVREILTACRIAKQCGEDSTIAFGAALLFAVHPVHTENVCAAVGLADLMSAFFGVLAIKIHITSLTSPRPELSRQILATIVAAGVAMFFKEQGVTTLGICCAYDCIYWFNIIRCKHGKNESGTRTVVISSLAVTIGCILLLWLRLHLIGYQAPTFHEEDNPVSFIPSRMLRFVNYSYIYALNVWILVYPIWLCFDWSMGCIPLITSLLDFRVAVVVAFWIVVPTLTYAALFNANKSIRIKLQVALAFGVIPFLPASNIFFKVGFVIAERALYLSSIGFALLVSFGWDVIKRRKPFVKVFGNVPFLLVCGVLGVRCFQRSLEWNDEKLLFASGLDVCPLNAKVHYNIAKVAADAGDKKTAIEEYERAIELNPGYYHAMNNLANIIKDNRAMEAKTLLERAISIKPDFAAAQMNLGIVFATLKDYDAAEQSYKAALRSRTKYADCMFNLGNLYLEQKRFDEALLAWRNSTILKPQLTAAWNNIIVMLDNRGMHEKALLIAAEAVRFHPNESWIHFNYANVLGKLKKFEEAERRFQIAIDLSEEAVFYANLGVLYHRWKRFDEASAAYSRAIELNPAMESTKENLKSLLRRI